MKNKNKNKNKILILFAVISLAFAACGSDSADVPSLSATPTPADEGEIDAEAAMMAFTECIREQGIDVDDPQVDANGNVMKPEFNEDIKRKDLGEVWEGCSEHLEGISLGGKRESMSETVDQYVEIAECLREEGYEYDDPTEETMKQWFQDFRATFDWNDPDAVKSYETCSGEPLGEGKGGFGNGEGDGGGK